MCTIQRNKFLKEGERGPARLKRKTAPPKVAFADVETWKKEYESIHGEFESNLDGLFGNANQDAGDIAFAAAAFAIEAADAAVAAVELLKEKHEAAAVKMQAIGRGRAGRKVHFGLKEEKVAWDKAEKPCICCGMSKDPACIIFQTTGGHEPVNKAMYSIAMEKPKQEEESTVRASIQFERRVSPKLSQSIRTAAVYGHSQMDGSFHSLSESGFSSRSFRHSHSTSSTAGISSSTAGRSSSAAERSMNSSRNGGISRRCFGRSALMFSTRDAANIQYAKAHRSRIDEEVERAVAEKALLKRQLKACGKLSVAFSEIARDGRSENLFTSQPSPNRRLGWGTTENLAGARVRGHANDGVHNSPLENDGVHNSPLASVDLTTSCPRPRRGRPKKFMAPNLPSAKYAAQFASHSVALQKRTKESARKHAIQRRTKGQLARAIDGVVAGFNNRAVATTAAHALQVKQQVPWATPTRTKRKTKLSGLFLNGKPI
jgi:hypothetical protein